MKLCPQCDFIYEDDQILCDMDGKELVTRDETGESATRPSRFTVNLPAQQKRGRSSLVVFLVVGLIAFLSVVGLTRLPRARSGSLDGQLQQPPPAITSGASKNSPTQSAEETAAAVSQDLPAAPANEAETIPATQPNATTGGKPNSLISSARPVGAVSTPNDRHPVIIRLNNGATIKADEAWEKRGGLWYRQGSVVTFIDKSRVRTVETSTSASRPAQTPKATDGKAEPTKKDSTVSSLLKKTGRILKRPFRF